MTSRVSFYKAMLQDLRHKIWMIALSCLGSFLAMPVFYLLLSQDWYDRISRWYVESAWTVAEYKLEQIMEFFQGYMVITGGIILVAGAVIVGLFGFRHVFSKKMVDQYHSLPITRKNLFLVQYINGFLIWFVPMFLGAVICAVMAGFFLGDLTAWITALSALALTLGSFVIAFLLVYHVVIIAVMLSGNVLNTLLNGAILSFGAVLLYLMFEVFASTYFETYYSFVSSKFTDIVWASPMVSAVYQLHIRTTEGNPVFPVIMNLVMVVLMWVAGLVLYLRRPSELAEQGMKIKPVQVVFKAVVVILAGMCGWIFFDLLTGALAWMMFGALLTGILSYGIMDIIFHMDFKAFFAHKVQMSLTVLAALCIGFVFKFDLIGFDSYVPKEDRIESMGIYINALGINSITVEDRITDMEYTDQEVIHAFLEKVASREDGQYPLDGYSARAYVRVTEKGGRTYYRQYRVWEEDEALTIPILKDASYIESNVIVPQWIIDNAEEDVKYGHVELENSRDYHKIENPKHLTALYEAYNADMLANPELYIYQEDEVIGNLYVNDGGSDDYSYYLRLDIYDSMEQVKAVLQECGYETILDKVSARELDHITVTVYYNKYNENLPSLAHYFGLEEGKEVRNGEYVFVNMSPDSVSLPSAVEIAEVKTKQAEYRDYYYEAVFDKQEDMEELLEILSVHTPDYKTLFSTDYCSSVDVMLYFKNGDTDYVSLKEGRMPEKFLDDFKAHIYE